MTFDFRIAREKVFRLLRSEIPALNTGEMCLAACDRIEELERENARMRECLDLIAGTHGSEYANPREQAFRCLKALAPAPEGEKAPARVPFDSMPCPHSFIVIDRCRACGAYLGPQP